MERVFLELITAEIEKILTDEAAVEPLQSALRHMLFPGGKRIRPVLALSFCQDMGGDPERLLPAATALEFIHTSSLIHDDLPAMDDDDIRRGKPSCHKAFGDATAVLAGDILIALAHIAISRADFPESTIANFHSILARTYFSLCNGQQLDISNETGASLLDIHEQKTGALFGASFAFGALGVGENRDLVSLSESLGRLIGVAFQVRDDLLDASATNKGRPAGSDKRNRKVTFLVDDKAAQEKLEEIRAEIDETLSLIKDRMAVSEFTLTRPVIDKIFAPL
ncbi:MAG: polyprenyl synthetase family protein [Candidatus Dadabacteria bacterium]|nr:MAG: polyprenyl synthetase family protein [Candidatus Dadabacteria bacterium]